MRIIFNGGIPKKIGKVINKGVCKKHKCSWRKAIAEINEHLTHCGSFSLQVDG